MRMFCLWAGESFTLVADTDADDGLESVLGAQPLSEIIAAAVTTAPIAGHRELFFIFVIG